MASLTAVQAARIQRCPVVVLSANRFTSQLVRSLFFGIGMQDIAVADNADAALARMQLCRIDLMVADTGPSTFDPMGVLRVLRDSTDQRQAGAPIILLETTGQVAKVHQLLGLQNITAVQKPLSAKQFNRVVYKALLDLDVEDNDGADTRNGKGRMAALLLSGNPYTAQVVRALLLSVGLADVAVASSPAEAERQLSKASFDLVIADSGPASFDGLATIESLSTTSARTPILLLASNPSQSLVQRAVAAKVKAIATKPLDPDAFAERVRRVLGVKT